MTEKEIRMTRKPKRTTAFANIYNRIADMEEEDSYSKIVEQQEYEPKKNSR